MAELPRQSNRPFAIVLPEGGSVAAFKEGDDVVLEVLGPEGDGVTLRLPTPAAAYIAGGLTQLSGVRFG